MNRVLGSHLLAIVSILLLAASSGLAGLAGEIPYRAFFGHPSVQRELNLTEVQQRRTDDIVAEFEMQTERCQREAAAFPGGKEAAKALRGRMEEAVMTLQGERFTAMLDRDQITRLWQIGAQSQGPEVFNDNRVQRVLQLTDDQAQKIGEIFDSMNEEFDKVADDRKIDMQGLQREMFRIGENCRERLLTVLTPQQRKDFDELMGKPFDIEQIKPMHLR